MNFLSYLFTPTPGKNFIYYYPMLGLAIFLIIGAIVSSIIYKKKKKSDFAYKRLFKKLTGRLVTMGILTLILIAVRYENIPYFSMRIWIYLFLLLLSYMIYSYIKIAKIEYPKEKMNTMTNLKIHKPSKQEANYLPNKKRRK